MSGMSTDDGDVIIVRHRRWGWWVVIALLAAGLLTGGALWWRAHAVDRAADAYAASVASALAAGRLPESLDVADRVAAQEDLARVLDGMGETEHTVTVGSVALQADGQGVVTLEQRWLVRADAEPWRYTTRMRIRHVGGAWQGRWEPAVVAPDLTAGQGLRVTRVAAKRGDIVDQDGNALVTRRPVVRVGIDKTKVDAATAATSAKALALAVGVEPGPYVAAVRAAGPRAFVEAIVLREDAPELTRATAGLSGIPGSFTVRTMLPLAPTAAFARPILGSVGPATAEIVEKSGGAVQAHDLVGLSGLQAAQDERLRGEPGVEVRVVDLADGASVQTVFDLPARDGLSLRVSLDEHTQLAAEAALAKVEPASAIVAIRTTDGHVVAAASGPGSKGQSTATLGRFAPGSSFKVVTTLALLRAGLDAASPVECPATITVEGRVFHNHTGYPAGQLGRIDLRRALAHSCNTAFIGVRGLLTPDALADAAAAVGLTADPALGVPATLGAVPRPDSQVGFAAALIGQGEVLTSPLGMATVAASIGGGREVHPVLVLDSGPMDPARTPGGPSGTATQSPADHPSQPAQPARSDAAGGVAPITGMEAATLRDLMRAVVTEGTAHDLADAPGGEVAAKTGTAEYGTDTPPRTHAWMIAIRGDLAVAVFVADGAGGASTAGPALEDFLRRIAG